MTNATKLLIAAAGSLFFAGQATAAITWTLTGPSTTASGVTVTAKAYSNTGNVTGTSSQNHANNGAIQTIQAATLQSYSGGLGISNADACSSGSNCDLNEGSDPEHAIDNQQRYDMILLSFSAPVKLQSLQLGWSSNDSDMTVLAYTGSGAPTTATNASNKTFVGLAYTELVTKGWTGIGHYADVSTSAPTTINAQSQVSSSYWLIGAYNPLALNPLANPGGPTNFSSTSYDYVKLKSVIGVMAAPEPGSVALLSAALMALFAIRRRKWRGADGAPA